MPLLVTLLLLAAAAEAAASPSPGGSVSGVVTYAGPEKDGSVTPTQDAATCGGDPRPEGSLLVRDGVVQSAIAWLEGAFDAPATTPPVLVDNAGCAFSPRVSVAFVGATLITRNSDPVLHATNLTLAEGPPLANLALPPGGPPRERVLRRPGLVSVRCDVHEWMKAWIFVAPHRFAAVSGEDGTFRFDGVPPGEHELRVWHERLGERRLRVVVAADADAAVRVPF